MKKIMLFTDVVFFIAGTIACVDIILAEFFDKGSMPDSSFIFVLAIWPVVATQRKRKLFFYMPCYLSAILYILSSFEII